jgi:beta-phosphoglucomutase
MVFQSINAVIFDLDGVICSTDEYHYLAWKMMADQAGIPFDRTINNQLRGISRMASLEIILKQASRSYTTEEKEAMAESKNTIYRSLLEKMSPKDVSPDVLMTLDVLKRKKIPTAIGSSSKNTPLILDKIGLRDAFDAVADGNEITHSKPDPEVFLLAAHKLGVDPKTTLVVEDGDSGIEAAKAGGFLAAGISQAAKNPLADYSLKKLSDVLRLLRD